MNKNGLLSGWLIWAVIFLIVAIIAGISGLGYISGFSLAIAKGLTMVFVILFMISIIAHVIKNA